MRNDTILSASSTQLWLKQKTNLNQQEENNENAGKNQNYNIKWFNLPCSKSLKLNIGKYFRLLNKQLFSPGHNLREIFNKNTLKLSYFCILNLNTKIDGHDKKILGNTPPPKQSHVTVWRNKIPNEGSLTHWKCFILH